MAKPINNALVFKQTQEHNRIRNGNNRIVRHEGNSYLIRAVVLGKNLMASAEPMTGAEQPLLNLFDKSALAKALRAKVEAAEYS